MAVVRNITITLDPETAARARVEAAERNMSLSRYIGEVLREHMRKGDEYEQAMKRFFALKPFGLKGPPQKHPSRKELYEQRLARLRRR